MLFNVLSICFWLVAIAHTLICCINDWLRVEKPLSTCQIIFWQSLLLLLSENFVSYTGMMLDDDDDIILHPFHFPIDILQSFFTTFLISLGTNCCISIMESSLNKMSH